MVLDVMKISVAMTTFNGAQYLKEQLYSLLSQTLQPFELVIGDDISSDSTLDVIAEFRTVAPFPVSVATNGNRLGYADNFLACAKRCKGDFIAFCDQDDIWLPRKLETCALRLVADESLIALHTMNLVDANGRAYGHWGQYITGDQTFEPLQLAPYATGWGNSMVFARWLIDLVPPEKRPPQPDAPTRPLSHDTWVYMLAAALGRVSHLTEPLILYRQHGSNALGVSLWKPENAWKKALLVPVKRWRSEAGQAAVMSDILGCINCPSAPKASIHMKRLATILRTRIAIYRSKTILQRIGAFKAYGQFGQADFTVNSRVKSLVLGVLGVNRLTARLIGRE